MYSSLAPVVFISDGSSFTSYRKDPWHVPNSNEVLHFRGKSNLERTMDILEQEYGLGSAKDVVLTGGSAGGLSTYLHLDRVAERLPAARVYGAPVAGYFLDHKPMPGGGPSGLENESYTENIKYMYSMFNATGALSQMCQAHYGEESWRCIMAPYAQAFVETPFFAIQSRFDEWQLGPGIAAVPCLLGQEFYPP